MATHCFGNDPVAQAAIPWLPGMLGARLRILPSTVLGEERKLNWERREIDALRPVVGM